MSRFCGADYDGEGPPPEFWQQAARNAIRGKNGQVLLRELREALLVLPQPRLIDGALEAKGEVCAIGALARLRFLQGKAIADCSSFAELGGRFDLEDDWDTVEVGVALGMKPSMAHQIAYENDEGDWGSETPERRYQRMLRWIDNNLKAVD